MARWGRRSKRNGARLEELRQGSFKFCFASLSRHHGPTKTPVARLFLYQIVSKKLHIITITPGGMESLILELVSDQGGENETLMLLAVILARRRRRRLQLLCTLAAYMQVQDPCSASNYLGSVPAHST